MTKRYRIALQQARWRGNRYAFASRVQYVNANTLTEARDMAESLNPNWYMSQGWAIV